MHLLIISLIPWKRVPIDPAIVCQYTEGKWDMKYGWVLWKNGMSNLCDAWRYI